MNHVFDVGNTRYQQIIVEYLTPTGSGFGVTPEGEQVFMNKRLVDTMNVQAGDIYNAFLLPNYPDKRDSIPWRAMRVEPADVKLDLGHVAVDSDLENVIEFLKGYEEGACFTAADGSSTTGDRSSPSSESLRSSSIRASVASVG